jgi:outer membrane lipoprotein SlyB
MKKPFVSAHILLILSGLLAGCANSGANYRPIIDTQGVDFNRYEADLRDCQAFAKQAAGAGQSAAAGAIGGAVLGAAIAAAAGSNNDRAASARVGAVGGAVGAGVKGEHSQRNIINRCLAGRGYNVLQ